MANFLQFLDGKKAIICAVAGLVIAYLVQTNVMTGELGTLILSILNLLAGGTAIATNKVLGARMRTFNV